MCFGEAFNSFFLSKAFPNYRDGHLVHFCAGLTAGAVAPSVMAPLEISKTRLQVRERATFLIFVIWS